MFPQVGARPTFQLKRGYAKAMTWIDGVSVVGAIGTGVFGLISLKQSFDIRGLRRAITVHSQAAYNAWWYVGVQAEWILKSESVAELHKRGAEINGISHTTRNEVIAFGREYASEAPYYEPAWQPNKLKIS